MSRESPLVDVERLAADTFVRHAELFDTLGSTNDRAAELAGRSEVPTPALVVARLQTAGRGRGCNTWWSDDGALTFSLLLDTPTQGLTPRDWPKLSLCTAVAVCDAMSSELTSIPQSARSSPAVAGIPQSPLGIRWPNDVLVDDRKVCGILIESPGGPAPAKDRLIIGIGINVNNSWHNAPPEAGPEGTALCDVTGRRHDLQSILVRLLQALDVRLGQLRDGVPELVEAWRRLSVLTGRTVRVDRDSQCIEGECLGIGDDGALLVETHTGRQSFYSGTVVLVS